MQIRERGGKIEVLRSVYDREKKRCSMKLVGSINRYASSLSDNLRSKLTTEEAIEFEKWLLARITARNEATMRYSVRNAAQSLRDLANAISFVGIEESTACAIYDSWKEVTKALRKAGFKSRPKEK